MRLASRILAGVVLGCLLTAGRWDSGPDAFTASPLAGNRDGLAPAMRFAANADVAGTRNPELAAGQLLTYDPRGRGQVAEVFGKLTEAERIVVVVPGSDVDLAHYSGPRQLRYMAQAVYAEAAAQQPGSVAVIAWAGYVTPVGIGMDAARSGLAEAGADRLLQLLSGLASHVEAEFSLMCHGYGSVVCAYAAPELAQTGVTLSDIVVFGSPGMDVSTVSALGTSARVWAARAAADWVGWVPHVRVFGVGHGTDPTEADFGARVLTVPDADAHDGYLVEGTSSLRRLTASALGGADSQTPAVIGTVAR